MFPPDDTGDMDVAAENAANAVKLLMNSLIVDSQLQSEYGNDNVPYVEDIGRVERVETGDEGSEKEDDLPNFDLIFQELGKLDSSNKLLDVKARLMKLQESLVGGVLVDNNVVEGAVQEEETHQEVPAVCDDGPNPHISDSVSVAKEGISHQGPDGEKVIRGVVDNASNVLVSQQEMSKFVIYNQYGQQSLITLPSQATFMVQNSVQGNILLAPVGGMQLNPPYQ